MNKIGCGCFDKQDTQAQTADPVKKWSIKMSAAGDGFFSCIHPRKKEGEIPSFFCHLENGTTHTKGNYFPKSIISCKR